MAFAVGKKESNLSAEPNVVPLCDVLLVLLIIFMVVTPMIQKGVDVRLPTALNTINLPENPEIVLSIKKDGTMYVNQDQATMDNLLILLEDVFLSSSDPKLYLRADQELEYGNIIDVIEVLKNAGVDIVGIITEKKTGAVD
ncbi:MAG: biopolymer transporter ExbD [Candidatus Aminicenantes bacterium]|nr:biopolymer transporter ExbD [Candidatus Aminicenantes bacterium]